MKNIKYIYFFLSLGLILGACDQGIVDIPANGNVTPFVPGQPLSAGTADFSKYVAVGNSLIAGYQAGALFDEGQINSLPNILSQQFARVGGGDFVQPDINSVNGFNSIFSDLSDPNPANWIIKGRLRLFGSRPGPTDSDINAVPNPQVNPGFVYTGPPVNNFGVPGILLGQALIPQTGDWNVAGVDPRFNPYYARFASNPGVSTIIGDAVGAGGTFFTMWLGNNDVLLHAATGASGAAPFTSEGDFTFQYGAALSVMTTDPNIQGVVANIPDWWLAPYFNLVPYNSIVFAAGDPTIDAVNNAYADYNGGLALAVAGMLITQAEADKRNISFAAGPNGIVVDDESLTNLSALGLPSIRQATAEDLITLSAGAVLGTLADPNNPFSVIGVGVPLRDLYTLLDFEFAEVRNRTDAFNAIIANTVSALGLSDRVAVADINQGFKELVADSPLLMDGVAVTTSLAPPAGVFSEDGLHPNSRGYAIAANMIIDAINNKFGANIPSANVALFQATGFPL